MKLHRLQPDQVFALAGAEVVDAANCLAARQKRGGNRAADKPGGSRNKIFGQCFTLQMSGFRAAELAAPVIRPT